MKRIKGFFYILLMIIGILGVCDTLTLLNYTNVNTGTLFPGFVGILLIMYTSMKIWIHKNKPVIKNRILRYLVIAGITLFTISFVIVQFILISNSASQQNIKSDYLIILGSEVRGKTVSLILKERLDKGVEYLKRFPDVKVVVSGGQGLGEEISEAEAMKSYLIGRGINPEMIITEDKSTSTMENFKFSKSQLSSEKCKNITKIMVITSDFHMFRAKMLARRNGFEPYGITCSTPKSVLLNSYAREYFALIKSYFLDK